VQLRKGLALLPALAEGPQRSRQEFELRAALGWALYFLKGEGAPDAGEELIRARAPSAILTGFALRRAIGQSP
jgi:hypothetical protein